MSGLIRRPLHRLPESVMLKSSGIFPSTSELPETTIYLGGAKKTQHSNSCLEVFSRDVES